MKDSPDKDGPDRLLRWAQIKFTGIMNDLGDHLFDSSRPPVRHLANGADDWKMFGFDSLAVEGATWRGEVLMLILSASDPAEARRGLRKYHAKWDVSSRKWFGCEVQIAFQEAISKP